MFQCAITNANIEVGKYVIVKMCTIKSDAIITQLVEYENREGMIMLREISNKRIKNASKVIKIGKLDVCQVIKVENGNIDLSLKQVDSGEREKALSNFKKNKIAYQIVDKASKICDGKSISDIYKEKMNSITEKYQSMYRCFALLKEEKIDIDENDNIEKAFVDVINESYKPDNFKIRADIELICRKHEGVALIISCLDKVIEKDEDLSIVSLTVPVFSISKISKKKNDGILDVQDAINIIKDESKNLGIYFNLVTEPKTFGEKAKFTILNLDDDRAKDHDSSSYESE